MPIALLLDVSPSTSTLIDVQGHKTTTKRLAFFGISAFLNKLCMCNQLECVSLSIFASSFEQKCAYTRDYNKIIQHFPYIESLSETGQMCMGPALRATNEMIKGEWGPNTFSHIIMITGGCTSEGEHSLKEVVSKLVKDNPRNLPSVESAAIRPEDRPLLPFSFPAKLYVVCITTPEDPSFCTSKPLYQSLVDRSGFYGGLVTTPKGELNEHSVAALLKTLAEKLSVPFTTHLSMGHLKEVMFLHPAPYPYYDVNDKLDVQRFVLKRMNFFGFIPTNEIGSPVVVSRHLVYPSKNQYWIINAQWGPAVNCEVKPNKYRISESPFSPLLLQIMKKEKFHAFIMLAPNWFGFLSYETRGNTNFMVLNVLRPGLRQIPGLDFKPKQVRPLEIAVPSSSPPPQSKEHCYPDCTLWVTKERIECDIEELVYLVHQVPKETERFYAAINKFKRTAIALGWLEALNLLATRFDVEMLFIPSDQDDCKQHLQRAANLLRYESGD